MYQPADAVRLPEAGFSKKMPSVPAPPPKAAVMRDASPYPVDAPITRTRLGALLMGPWACTNRICSLTLAAQPTGCAVVQMKPLTLGWMTIADSLASVVLMNAGILKAGMGKGQLNTAVLAVFSNILTNYAGR